MTTEKVISVLETTRLMFEMSLSDSEYDKDSAEAREDNEETIEAINEAIKALDEVEKYKKAIEDIKAEISGLSTSYCGGYIGLDKQEVLGIIEKSLKGGELMNIRQKYKKAKRENDRIKYVLSLNPEAKKFYDELCSPVKTIYGTYTLQKIKIKKVLTNREDLRYRHFLEEEITKELLLSDIVKRQIEWQEDLFAECPTIEANIFIGVKRG